MKVTTKIAMSSNALVTICDFSPPRGAQARRCRPSRDAPVLVPDRSPLVGYFQRPLEASAPTVPTQFVHSNRPLHYFKEQGRASGRLEWVNAYFCSPWQASWLLSSVGNAINKGTPAFEGFRDWLGEYIIGFYTSYHDPAHDFVGPDGVTYKYDPKDAMPYSMATSLWQCEVYTDDNGTAADASDDFLATRKLFKIKDFTNYGEIWYYNKVNQDNEWSQYTSSPGVDPAMLPDANCENWPIRPDGWGHGFVYPHLATPPRQGTWYGWHRYGSSEGLGAADVRFINEAKAIRRLGGEVWRVSKIGGPGTDSADHQSETEMDLIKEDHAIEAAHGQIPLLLAMVDALL